MVASRARATVRRMQRISFLVFDDVQTLDVAGPLEVFATANELDGPPAIYTTRVLSPDGAPVRTSGGVRWIADGGWDEVEQADTVVVPGGVGTRALERDAAARAALDAACGRAARVASVCTGAFLLGEAGLLDGRRSVTHWSRAEELAARFATTVEADRLHVQDGVWTSAGVSAGMDLALAMVEEDASLDLAHRVARWLVLFVRRDGCEPQLSPALESQAAAARGIARIQSYIANHPDADLRVPALAKQAGMSARNFARSFTAEVGLPPGRYVRRARARLAQRLLAQTDGSLDEVAARCGLGTRHALARALRDELGLEPRELRR